MIETVLDLGTVAAFLMDADIAGIPTEEIRFWWHSHATAPAFFSATDEKTIDGFDTAPWWVSYVGNHAGASAVRLDVFPTDTLPVRLTQPVALEPVFDPAYSAEIENEIKQKVTSKRTKAAVA